MPKAVKAIKKKLGKTKTWRKAAQGGSKSLNKAASIAQLHGADPRLVVALQGASVGARKGAKVLKTFEKKKKK